MKFNNLRDGILLYSGEDDEGHGDFISLALKNKRVEFRFNLGSGPLVIRSNKDIVLGEWVAITASKSFIEGRLTVDGEIPVVEKVHGNHRALVLHTPLYAGGFDKHRIKINNGVGVQEGFNGCISDISISGIELDIIKSIIDAGNVKDCASLNNDDNNESNNDINDLFGGVQYSQEKAQTGCSSSPCRNEGRCLPVSGSEYRCECIHGYR